MHLLLLLTLAFLAAAQACFDSTQTKCVGETPRVDPELYCCMIRMNRHKFKNATLTTFIDKLKFKEYCASIGLKTAKNLRVYGTDPKEMNFTEFFPNFVVKLNKGSGKVLIYRNGTYHGKNKGKMTPNEALRWISSWPGPYKSTTEPHYDFTIEKVFVEELLDPYPDDFKVNVVNYQVDSVLVYRGHDVSLYSADFQELLPYGLRGYNTFVGPSNADIMRSQPALVAKMKEVAERIARDIGLDFVRVDLFLMNGEFYGGEATLSPSNGKYYIMHKDHHIGNVRDKNELHRDKNKPCPTYMLPRNDSRLEDNEK